MIWQDRGELTETRRRYGLFSFKRGDRDAVVPDLVHGSVIRKLAGVAAAASCWEARTNTALRHEA